MKRIYTTLLLLSGLAMGCKKDLISTNVDPNNVSSVDPSLIFSAVLVGSTANDVSSNPGTYDMDMEPRTNYCHAFMQYGYSSFWSGTTYALSDAISSAYWNSFYTTVIKNIEYLMPILKASPELVNTYAAAKIWRVFLYQKLTDFYGDIPYSQAAKAYSENIFAPAYDPQQQIYDSLVTELQSAESLFDATKEGVQGDQFYSGSIAQWEKLGNSLLLRIGMRLIKVDPTQAATLVKQAVAAGVMQSNADMPVLMHNASAPNGFWFNIQDEHFYLHKTLVDHMKNTGDPRLSIYGAIHSGGTPTGSTVVSTDTTQYIGYSFSASDPAPTVQVTYPIYQPANTPFFDFEYAEVEFLLAEAVLRGYISGDAGSYYQNGITADMQSLALLPTSPAITGAQITDYLNRNPLKITAPIDTQIAQINTEFWVAGFVFDADEVWANWRRTGYPVLTPNPNTLTDGSSSPGVIPRKMPYPQSEFTLNSTSVNNALKAYGGVNDFSGRVWWDAQ